MIEIVTGDIFESKEKYLLHQTNCVTHKAAGLSKDFFSKYPWADIYARRYAEGIKDTPGQIMVRGDGVDKRYVINLLGQYYPGKPKFPTSALDGTKVREKYFHQCLLRVAKIENLESVAFPWRIGCNLGGGDWEHYLGQINIFANYIDEKQNARVIIYQREDEE